MATFMKITPGLILLFVLSAGCTGEKVSGSDRTASVRDMTTPEITPQETRVPAATTVKFSLKSTGFQEGGTIPSKYTCDGKDVSPPLSWSLPGGVTSFALIVDDPDAPGGVFTHWVLFDLPPNITVLPEGVPKTGRLDEGGIQGKNDFGEIGYNGPCPPAGKPHTYRFILYALDLELNLKPGANKQQVLKAMEGHVLSKSEIDGKYGRR
ncbi:Phosphatidylethanolamine-binding protein [uncultured archaeon]|nr:Phosphatidylethanolamine-binding protein [uncultured archaeon]